MNCAEKPYCAFALTVVAAAWLLIAVFVGETELLALLPAPVLPLTIWTLVAALVLSYWKIPAFRAFVEELDTRILVGFHLTRFVGFYFLYLAARGELPISFAKSAGWGDIAVAWGALVLLFHSRRSWMQVWNLAGLLDILFVVGSAIAQLLRDRSVMESFTQLPLSFLPTLVVPIIIATHLLIFARLRRAAPKPITTFHSVTP